MSVTRRHFVAGISTLPLLGGLGWTPGAQAAVEAPPGVLTLLVNPEPPSLSAFHTSAGTSLTASSKVLEGLLTYANDLSPQPVLATHWDIAPDGLTYTFTLRQGVKWHDGQPFSAADVAFSLDLVKRYHPRGGSTFASLERVETPDEHSVVLHLSKPVPYLIRAFAGSETPILPRHRYAEGDPLSNPLNNAPIGTGPFRFKQWVRGSHIEYERNPDYWQPGQPTVAGLILRVVPDSAARLAAFGNGSLLLGGESPVPLSDLERLTQGGTLKFTTEGYQYSGTETLLEFNLDDPLLGRLEVRQAIAHAIDREVIKKIVYYGYAEASAAPIPSNFPHYHYDGANPYPPDVQKANAILDAAGLPREGNWRFPLTLDPLPYGDSYQRTAVYIKSALARLGIEVQLRNQDFPSYIKRVYSDRAYQFAVNGMSVLFDPTVGLQRLYWSKNYRQGVPFSNGTRYANPEVDRLLEAAAVEPDEARRGELFRAFQAIVMREIPSLTLVLQRQVTLYNARVSGFAENASGVNGSLAGVTLAGPEHAHG